MANWFQPYLIPRDAWPSLRYSEALAVELEARLQERFGGPWSTRENGCEPPPQSWREPVGMVLQRDQEHILQGHWVAYVAVALVIVAKMSIQGEELGVLRHSELPGTLFPPARYLPDIRVTQNPEDWFYLSFLRGSDIAAEIRHATAELRECTPRISPEWNRGIKRYLHWLRTAQRHDVELAITFS
jgi:hypothetical protein